MEKPSSKSKKIRKYIWLTLYVIFSMVLVIESCLPGNVSSNHSTSLGSGLSDFINGIGGDQSQIIEPTSINFINKPTLTTFNVGDTFTLNAEISPENSSYKSIIYSSSDTNIATVSNEGRVRFLKSGEVDIFCKSSYNESLIDSINFTVLDVYPTSFTSILVDSISGEEVEKDEEGSYILKENFNYNIVTSFLPENSSVKNVSYIYSTSSYFSLSNNRLYARKFSGRNKLNLVVKVNDQLEQNINFYIKQDLENTIELKKLEIIGNKKLEVSLYDAINIITLDNPITINYYPENATYKEYELISFDENIVSVYDENTFIATGPGETTLKVQSVYYPEVYDELIVKVVDVEATMFTFSFNNNSTLMANMKYETSYHIVRTYYPSDASIFNNKINFVDYIKCETSDENIAYFDENYNLCCLKEGDVDVTIKVLKKTSLDKNNDENYIFSTKSYHIFKEHETVDFEINIDFFNGKNVHGGDRNGLYGEIYNLKKCVTFAGFLDKNNEKIDSSNLNTKLRFFNENTTNEIFEIDNTNKIRVRYDVRIYPYENDPDFYLCKYFSYSNFYGIKEVTLNEKTYVNNYEKTMTVNDRTYFYLGEVDAQINEVLNGSFLSDAPADLNYTYSLSLINGQNVCKLSPSTSLKEFSIIASKPGTTYLKISAFYDWGGIREVGFVIKINVIDFTPTSINLIIKRGDSIITPANISDEENGYETLLIGNRNNNYPDLVPIRVGDELTFETILNPEPIFKNILIHTTSEKLTIRSPKVIMNEIGTSTITIAEQNSGLFIRVQIQVTNHIGLNSEEEYQILKSSDHGGELSFSETKNCYLITKGYSYNLKLNFDEETTFKEVEYKSNDEEKLKVGNDGTLTPLNPGLVKITALVNDGYSQRVSRAILIEVKTKQLISSITDFLIFVRKGFGHFGAFFVLGICSSMFYYLTFDNKRKLFIVAILINISFGFIFSVLTEFIQVFIPGRTGLMSDVMLDFSGFLTSATIISLIFLILYIVQCIKNHKNRTIENN